MSDTDIVPGNPKKHTLRTDDQVDQHVRPSMAFSDRTLPSKTKQSGR